MKTWLTEKINKPVLSHIRILSMERHDIDGAVVRRLFVFLKGNLIFDHLLDELIQRDILNKRDIDDYICNGNCKCFKIERLIKRIIWKKRCSDFVKMIEEMPRLENIAEKIRDTKENTLWTVEDEMQGNHVLTTNDEMLQKHFGFLYMKLEPREVAHLLFQSGYISVDEHDEVIERNRKIGRLKSLLAILKKDKLYTQFVCTLQSLECNSVLETLQRNEQLESHIGEYELYIQHNFILLQTELPDPDLAKVMMEHELDKSNISDIESCGGKTRQISKLLKILLMKGTPSCKELLRVIKFHLKGEKLIQRLKDISTDKKKRGKPDLCPKRRSLNFSWLQENEEVIIQELDPLYVCDLLFEDRAIEIIEHDTITELKLRKEQVRNLLETVKENKNDCFHFFLFILQNVYNSIGKKDEKSVQAAITTESNENFECSASHRLRKLPGKPDDVQNELIEVKLKADHGSQGEQVLQNIHHSTGISEESISCGQMYVEKVSKGSVVLQLRPVTDQAVKTLLSARENNRLVEMITGMLQKADIAKIMDGTMPIEITVQVKYAKPGNAKSVKEISRTALIKHRMKANKNVLVYELESTALVSILRDSKAFDKLAIESVDKVTNNDERVEMLLSLVENGNSDVVEEFLSALKDLNYCDIVELIDPADIHTKAELIREKITSNYENILEEMQFTFAREVLSRCIGDADGMGKKILPTNGNRRERMSTFLQFILQEDYNVIEFENILKNNGLGDLLKMKIIQREHTPAQDIEVTVIKDHIPSSIEEVLFESVITLSYSNIDKANKQNLGKVSGNTSVGDQKKDTERSQSPIDIREKHRQGSLSEHKMSTLSSVADLDPTDTDESSMMDWESSQSKKDEPEPKHYAPKKRLQPKSGPTYQAQVAIPPKKIFGRSNVSSKEEFWSVVVALDFGTTYSGYAFWKKDTDPLDITSGKWKTGSKDVLESLKTPTSLLLNKENEVIEFGFEAEQIFKELVKDGNDKEYRFFRQFKMQLFDKKGFNMDMEVKDHLNNPMKALDAFSLSIRYLKDKCIELFQKKRMTIHYDEIQWILTVPAIWDESAKQLMRKAAEQAEIPSDQLKLALEPEAAAIYVVKGAETVSGKESVTTVKPGTKIMVADLGGGTADVTVLELNEDKTMKQLYRSFGGSWGGNLINDKIWEIMSSIFGKEIIEEFKKQTADYMDMESNIELRKRDITVGSRLQLPIPPSLADLCKTVKGKSYKELITQSKEYAGVVKVRTGKLSFEPGLVEEIFDLTKTSHIFTGMGKVLRNPNTKGIKDIILVGGFAQADMIGKQFKETFAEYNVIIPTDPVLAVLNGAVMFGQNIDIISSRITAHTYGFDAMRIFAEGDPKSRKRKYDDAYYCVGLFEKMVAIGESVNVGKRVEKEVFASSKDMKLMVLKFYQSDQKNPKFVTDPGCECIGKLSVEMPDLSGGTERSVMVSIKFGETEITVCGVDKTTGKKQETVLDLLGDTK